MIFISLALHFLTLLFAASRWFSSFVHFICSCTKLAFEVCQMVTHKVQLTNASMRKTQIKKAVRSVMATWMFGDVDIMIFIIVYEWILKILAVSRRFLCSRRGERREREGRGSNATPQLHELAVVRFNGILGLKSGALFGYCMRCTMDSRFISKRSWQSQMAVAKGEWEKRELVHNTTKKSNIDQIMTTIYKLMFFFSSSQMNRITLELKWKVKSGRLLPQYHKKYNGNALFV